MQPGKALQTLVAENTNVLENPTNTTCLAVGGVVRQDLGPYPTGGRSAPMFVGGLIDQLREINDPRKVAPICIFICFCAMRVMVETFLTAGKSFPTVGRGTE